MDRKVRSKRCIQRLAALATLIVILPLAREAQAQQGDYLAGPTAEIVTNKGSITIQLFSNAAPLSVANFVKYAQAGFYKGKIFSEVSPGDWIKAGTFNEERETDKELSPVPNESGNGLTNAKYTVAVSRDAKDPHSGTAGFFINLADNMDLDRKPTRWGFAVFGRVISGTEVVDSIAAVETTTTVKGFDKLPRQPVVIKSVKVLEEKRSK